MPSAPRKFLGWLRQGNVWRVVVESFHAAKDDADAIRTCELWLEANRRHWWRCGLTSMVILPEGMEPTGQWKEWE